MRGEEINSCFWRKEPKCWQGEGWLRKAGYLISVLYQLFLVLNQNTFQASGWIWWHHPISHLPCAWCGNCYHKCCRMQHSYWNSQLFQCPPKKIVSHKIVIDCYCSFCHISVVCWIFNEFCSYSGFCVKIHSCLMVIQRLYLLFCCYLRYSVVHPENTTQI